jgi:hypothetical protein
LRPFVLEIETDSTIQPNEDQEKQRRTEFLLAIGVFIAQAGPVVAAQPETAPFMAEMLKFTAGGFRAGRQLDDAIDEFAEKLKASASQPQPNPEAEAAKAEAQIEGQRLQMEGAKIKAEVGKIEAETARIMQGEPVETNEPTPVERHKAGLDIRKLNLDEKKLSADVEGKNLDRQASLDEKYLSAGIPPGYRFEDAQAEAAQIAQNLEDEMDEKFAAILEVQTAHNAQMAEALIELARAMTAPKRVVRDNSGKAVGIETVMEN